MSDQPRSLPRASIHFVIDENLPADQIGELLATRGHTSVVLDLGIRDSAILYTAEKVGAVIISADVWFYAQLRRASPMLTARYRRTGIIKLPGHSWTIARRALERWLPIIEAEYDLAQHRADRRIVFDLRQNTALIDA